MPLERSSNIHFKNFLHDAEHFWPAPAPLAFTQEDQSVPHQKHWKCGTLSPGETHAGR